MCAARRRQLRPRRRSHVAVTYGAGYKKVALVTEHGEEMSGAREVDDPARRNRVCRSPRRSCGAAGRDRSSASRDAPKFDDAPETVPVETITQRIQRNHEGRRATASRARRPRKADAKTVETEPRRRRPRPSRHSDAAASQAYRRPRRGRQSRPTPPKPVAETPPPPPPAGGRRAARAPPPPERCRKPIGQSRRQSKPPKRPTPQAEPPTPPEGRRASRRKSRRRAEARRRSS